jgi:hypothetical protein
LPIEDLLSYFLGCHAKDIPRANVFKSMKRS